MQLLGWEADQAQVTTQRVHLSIPGHQRLVLGHLQVIEPCNPLSSAFS